MTKSSELRAEPATRKGLPYRNRRTYSQHVERVISRIFAKQREFEKRRSFRPDDVVDIAADQ